MEYVKFIRGSQSAYNYLKTNNKLNQDTLYFIYDKDNLELPGKLYLGSILISDDSERDNISFNIVSDQLAENQILVYKDGAWENCDINSLDLQISNANIFKLTKTAGTTDEQLLATLTTAAAGDFAIITYNNQNTSYIKNSSEWVSLYSVVEQLTADSKSITIENNLVSIYGFNKEFYQWNEDSASYNKTTGFASGLELKTVETSADVFEVGWFEPNPTTTEGLTSIVNTLQTDLNSIASSVGNIDELNHISGDEDSTIIDEINDINERLAWQDIE